MVEAVTSVEVRPAPMGHAASTLVEHERRRDEMHALRLASTLYSMRSKPKVPVTAVGV